MQFKLTWIVFILSISSAFGQSYWISPIRNADKSWCFEDRISQELYTCDSVSNLQNFNPLLSLENQTLLLDLNGKDGLNIYTVYKTKKNQQEQYIWGISSQNQENQILTDYRLANLKAGKVMNFVDFLPGEVQLNNFLDHEKNSKEVLFKLGGNSERKDLPLKANSSDIAELIIFDKPLGPMGKQILETSLALKYSISLAPSIDYRLSPKGKILWDAQRNQDFHHNIAGIAENEDLHLNQKQSKSSIEKGFLAIAYQDLYKTNVQNKSKLPFETSLIWGDNMNGLNFYHSNEGLYVLDRQWRIENNGFSEVENFTLQLEEEIILNQIEEGHTLWLKIRKNHATKLFQSEKGNIFKDLHFFPGSQLLEFIKAPSKWIDVNIIPANCKENKTATLDLDFIGVEYPFHLIITSKTNRQVEFQDEINQNEFLLDGLNAGQYLIEIIKDNDLLISQEVNIVDASIPELKIPKNYIFDSKDPNVVDASFEIQGAWEYEWTSPHGEVHFKSIMELNQTGTYWIKIYNDECFSYTKINVEIIDDNIKSAVIYPNPSPNGLFFFELELNHAYLTHVEISNISGRRLFTKEYEPALYIQDHIQLYGNGMYFITFRSGSSVSTKKLVVQFP